MKFQSPLPGSPKRLHLCSVHRTAGTRVHWPVDTCRSPLTDVQHQHAAALLPAPPPQQRTTPPRSPGPPRTPATRRIKASRRSNGWQATALGQVVLQRLLRLVGRLTSRRTAPAPAGDTWTVTTDEEVSCRLAVIKVAGAVHAWLLCLRLAPETKLGGWVLNHDRSGEIVQGFHSFPRIAFTIRHSGSSSFRIATTILVLGF